MRSHGEVFKLLRFARGAFLRSLDAGLLLHARHVCAPRPGPVKKLKLRVLVWLINRFMIRTPTGARTSAGATHRAGRAGRHGAAGHVSAPARTYCTARVCAAGVARAVASARVPAALSAFAGSMSVAHARVPNLYMFGSMRTCPRCCGALRRGSRGV